MGKLTAAALAILAFTVATPAVILDRVAATVDGRAITESEVRRTILTAGLQPSADESAMQFRDRVLSAMIDDYLRYRDALRFSPAPPDAAAVDGALRKLRQRLRSEGKDPDAEFRQAGMSIEEVRASIEKQLVVSQYVRERFSVLALVSAEVSPLSTAEEESREEVRARRTAEEVEKWTKDLREKARITVYAEVPPFGNRRKIAVSDGAKPKT